MSEPLSKNIYWTPGKVTAEQRGHRSGQFGCVIWLTGLSASGKSTIAMELERELFDLRKLAYVLDGDNTRQGLCSDLGFSPEDRRENIRRVREVVRLFADAGIICITAFISPYRADREVARRLVPPGKFIEVYVNAPLEVCEQRDPKGLYAKAQCVCPTRSVTSCFSFRDTMRPKTQPAEKFKRSKMRPERRLHEMFHGCVP